jgi:steroid delta-isomerase-like uncharacterized protein
MPARHALTILAVRDLAAAARFYRQAFAWRPIVEAPVYVELALPGGMRLGLYQRESFARNTGQLPAPIAAGAIAPTELYFYVDDAEAAVARLLAAGARLLGGLAPRDWGDEAAYLADPDGNVLVVAREAGAEAPPPDAGQIAARWLRAWQGGDTSVLRELHAPGFVDRSPSGRSPDNAGFERGIAELYAAFPDFHGDAEEISVDREGGRVTVIWSATGTHRGRFLGVAATGRRIRFRGIEVLTVRGGQIVERWGEWDGIDLALQLGALAAAPAAGG